jgi:hypothetical protein
MWLTALPDSSQIIGAMVPVAQEVRIGKYSRRNAIWTVGNISFQIKL